MADVATLPMMLQIQARNCAPYSSVLCICLVVTLYVTVCKAAAQDVCSDVQQVALQSRYAAVAVASMGCQLDVQQHLPGGYQQRQK
jgi:hypothetical protein